MKRDYFWAAAALCTLAVTPNAFAQGAAPDIRTMCGTKPAVVALADGVGDNAWRRIARAGFEDEASKCSNITKVLYTDAGGSLAKYNSDINSLVAQGANVIVTFVDFGDAQLPALRKATAAGVAVVPYLAAIGGKPGRDYVANVRLDATFTGNAWANWMGQNIKKGNLIVLAGPPASPADMAYQDAIVSTLQKYPDIHLLQKDYVVTNWNPSDSYKAVVAAIAKYGKIDMVIADYSVEAKAAVQAFREANLSIPAIATISPSNDLDCEYVSYKKAGKPWKFVQYGGTVDYSRGALRRGLANFEGTKNPESDLIYPATYADTFKGIDPKCDPTLPPDADLSGSLPITKIKTLLAQ